MNLCTDIHTYTRTCTYRSYTIYGPLLFSVTNLGYCNFGMDVTDPLVTFSSASLDPCVCVWGGGPHTCENNSLYIMELKFMKKLNYDFVFQKEIMVFTTIIFPLCTTTLSWHATSLLFIFTRFNISFSHTVKITYNDECVRDI